MTNTVSPIKPPAQLLPPPTNAQACVRINAALIADANHSFAPGSLVLKAHNSTWQIHAVNHPAQIDTIPLPTDTKTINLPDQIIIPALINAHTHLDLTHIGPQPHDPAQGFVPWVDMIRENRLTDTDQITASVNQGIQKSLNGGTIAVGDIAGAPNGNLTDAPIKALANSPLLGTSHLEYFGIGKSAQSAIDRIDAYLNGTLPNLKQHLNNSGVTFGLSPHATNTIGYQVYQHAAKRAKELNIPLTTHLAETLEERQFIATAQGPQRQLLERFKVWDDSILNHIGKNQHPVHYLESILKQHQILAAHVNDAIGPNGDQAIDILAQTNTPVAYCPRAHQYFGHDKSIGPHRYQDMLEANINVSLGTDSIVNLNTPDRITTLDDMRLLSQRDATPMQILLKMTTTNPARALNLNPNAFTITPGQSPAGLIALQIAQPKTAWQSAMQSTLSPAWLIFQENCP